MGVRSSWRKCHKTAKNDPACFVTNLPSKRNAYKHIQNSLSGGNCPQLRIKAFPKRCREANSDREFGLGNLSGKVKMDMFGGLTKTSSRIAIAAALGMTLGGFAMGANTAKAADLGGDCCADLEERVAELEATTVRKGNKKVSVTLSGLVVKLGTWWDDGHETNFYVGDKDTTLSSHFQISGSAVIAPGWSGGYTISVETRGGNAIGDDNQFIDDSAQ